jgi:ABC-2 type transport system permease protein
MKVLRHIIRKEFLQLRRDRKMIPILLGAPIIQLIVLGYAAVLDVDRIPMLLLDRDQTQASGELCERFLSSGYFRLAGQTQDPAELDRGLIEGRAKLALVIQDGYGKAVGSGQTPRVQVLADGSEGNLSMLAMGYASVVVAQQSGELVAQRAKALALRAGAPLAAGRIDLVPRVWYNPDLKSLWFFVPAILAMVLMLTTMVLPSMAVVREKEIGTMEQIMVTPVRPWQLIVGKLFPFAAMGLLTVIVITGLTVFYFGVPLRGSFLLLLLMTALFLLSTLGLGLLASTLVRNQQQAMLVSIFLLQIPMIYLSGLIFPIDNMPKVIQIATYGIPLRYYTTVIRGIFLKGAGLRTLWPEMTVMLLSGIGILGLASSRFRKRLD